MQEKNSAMLEASLVRELIKEKRSERRWKMFRFIAWFILIGYFIYSMGHLMSNSGFTTHEDQYTALIRLDGMIAPGNSFSAEEMLPVLNDAFQDKAAKGVTIVINSPGGTPVQSAIIHDAILTLKKKYRKKVIVVGEDMLTSGAYYVAVAADKIYVNPNTITGSIGVVMKGFGFVELLKKIGIERRVYVSGNNKDRLDPFLPQNPEDIAKIKMVMTEVHQNFTQAVIAGRHGKLKTKDADLFNGDFWSGQTAYRLGLVDGLGNLSDAPLFEGAKPQKPQYQSTSKIIAQTKGQSQKKDNPSDNAQHNKKTHPAAHPKSKPAATEHGWLWNQLCSEPPTLQNMWGPPGGKKPQGMLWGPPGGKKPKSMLW